MMLPIASIAGRSGIDAGTNQQHEHRSTAMNTTNRIATITALTTLFAAPAFGAQAAEEVSLLAMRPLQALTLDRGNEHIVSYYLSKNGRCQLYVTHAADPQPNTFTATRFEATIEPGKAARFVSTAGNAFEFSCASDGFAMNVMPLEQVAAATN
jgi:hypothetical protein